MLRGMYTTVTGMMTLQKQMDVISNNMVNAETNGYRADKFISRSFEDEMIARINDKQVVQTQKLVGPFNFGVRVDELRIDFSQGPLEETGRLYDFAIEGDGFFVVNTPAGERYTRAGDFNVDQYGNLITQDGYSVMGMNGPINIGMGTPSIDSAGNLYSDGQFVDTLRIETFADLNVLRKEGDNYMYTVDGSVGAQSTNFMVAQSYIEGSNANVANLMMDMLTVYRAYETNQRMMQMQDSTLEKAVNNIGTVR